MRLYWIAAKLFLFTFSYFLFLPMIFFIGRNEYFFRVVGGVQRLINEAYDKGCINQDEKRELESDLYGD